jgi:hypothetical protein
MLIIFMRNVEFAGVSIGILKIVLELKLKELED